MVRLNRYRAVARPAPPARQTSTRIWLRLWSTFLLFSALAHSFWFNLVGPAGAGALLIVCSVVTATTWLTLIRRGALPPFAFRRLPWLTVAYSLLAVISVGWSLWPVTTLTTAALLVVMGVHGIFVAAMLTWAELVRAIEIASRWTVGISVGMEVWIALRGRPLGPNVLPPPSGADAHWYWIRGHLFDTPLGGERIQGLVGNANLLAYVLCVALLVFLIQFAARPSDRVALGLWIIVTAYMLHRAGSVAALAALCTAAIIFVGALIVRRIHDLRRRLTMYGVYVASVALALTLVTVFQDVVLDSLGRDETLTGRAEIWRTVLERAEERPVLGGGFASPWLPWDPAFDGWIVDHGMTVFHAHSVWVDVFFQLGAVGVLILALIYAAVMWRSWFFAVDRPRWDLDANRPYHPYTLLPLMVTTIILVSGYAESGAMTNWGWLFVVMFAFKLKISPVMGIGAYEDVDGEDPRHRQRWSDRFGAPPPQPQVLQAH